MPLNTNLKHVLATIQHAAKNCNREPNAIRLLAVSKQQSVDKIRAAFQAGQLALAENYVQEAIDKQALLKDLPIEWHFIGHIQSNKAKIIAAHFDWVHSVDRASIAKALNQHRPPSMPPLNICIQVNIDQEDTKSGVNPKEISALITEIQPLNRLKLRGLMAIPKKMIDPQVQYATFLKVAELQNTLIEQGVALDTLSMGMSDDFIPAIQAGSTMVRIGTAIFGERTT